MVYIVVSGGVVLSNYYAEKLNSSNLLKVYDTQLDRVKRYLDEEIDFVRKNLEGHETLLELGAGYGRIVKELASSCQSILGIDISMESALLSEEYLKGIPNASVLQMDVHNMDLKETFDVILCLQNGLSAMKITTTDLINRILDKVTVGGKVYFSTYSENFWEHRLSWFVEQSEKRLLGEIDFENTRDGVIMCKDGFKAITYSMDQLHEIGRRSGYPYKIVEVDASSLFLIISKS